MLRDRRIIFTASFLRAVANGLIGVLAGIYLAQLGLDPAAWGAVLGAGIAGTAVGAAGVMFCGDRIGRTRWLVRLRGLAAADRRALCLCVPPPRRTTPPCPRPLSLHCPWR